MSRDHTPNPNFARLLTEQDLDSLVISAHVLRRFVERLQPDIPGAEQVAESMARLEDIGKEITSGLSSWLDPRR